MFGDGGNSGCNISTYGSTFNNNGGGVYAMLLNDPTILVWFWPQQPVAIPLAKLFRSLRFCVANSGAEGISGVG